MDTLTGIKMFLQVVESGSFVAAADRFDVSTAMVSKHVMNVEGRLGVRLLNRNSRTLSLTEPGRVYFERCKSILNDLEETELELGSLGATARGTLRITCPSWFAGQCLADVLARYRERYPQVVVDVSFEDRVTDLIEEGYDLALRVSPDPRLLPAGLIARPVKSMSFFVGASREYLKRHGTPKSPEDLAERDCIAVGLQSSWVLRGPNGKIEVPARIVARYRSMAGVAHAVAAGIGMAALPRIYFEDPLFERELVPVLTDRPIAQATLYLVYVSRRNVPLKIRSFIDFFLEHVPRDEAPESAAVA
ncbi:MAG: LysR family transcriptional regulator [Gammaproteobacteria bacterium]|nr:LysR family transcriptional regulator [Gammaproteobacteria bacterium]